MIAEIDGLLANLEAGKPAPEPEEDAKPEPPPAAVVEKETPAPVLIATAPKTEQEPEQAPPHRRWWLWGAGLAKNCVALCASTKVALAPLHDVCRAGTGA
jgi:hypothetical protein